MRWALHTLLKLLDTAGCGQPVLHPHAGLCKTELSYSHYCDYAGFRQLDAS